MAFFFLPWSSYRKIRLKGSPLGWRVRSKSLPCCVPSGPKQVLLFVLWCPTPWLIHQSARSTAAPCSKWGHSLAHCRSGQPLEFACGHRKSSVSISLVNNSQLNLNEYIPGFQGSVYCTYRFVGKIVVRYSVQLLCHPRDSREPSQRFPDTFREMNEFLHPCI